MDPVVIGELEFAAECFKPRALGVEIFSRDREGKMIDGRFGRAQAAVAGLIAPIKESQNLSVSAVAVRDFEESRIWKPPHQLQADDVLIKGLHSVEVIHSQRNFTEGFDLAGGHAGESLARPRITLALIPPKPNELLII